MHQISFLNVLYPKTGDTLMAGFLLHPVVGGFQSQDAVLPSAGGHEDSTSGFGQSGQSFYNNKAVPRGAPRSARGVMNGYRGSSNGFRGTSANTEILINMQPVTH